MKRDAGEGADLHHRPARRGDHHRGTRPILVQTTVPRPAGTGCRRIINSCPGGAEPSTGTTAARFPRVNVSVKLSAGLYSQFDPIDPEGTIQRRSPGTAATDPVAWRRSPGRSSTSTWSSTASRTRRIYIFRRHAERAGVPRLAGRGHRHAGVPAGHRTRPTCSSATGPKRMNGRRPVWVRLVKGAYWDYETVKAAQEPLAGAGLATQKWESDAALRAVQHLPPDGELSAPGCDRRSPATTSAASAHALAVAESN